MAERFELLKQRQWQGMQNAYAEDAAARRDLAMTDQALMQSKALTNLAGVIPRAMDPHTIDPEDMHRMEATSARHGLMEHQLQNQQALQAQRAADRKEELTHAARLRDRFARRGRGRGKGRGAEKLIKEIEGLALEMDQSPTHHKRIRKVLESKYRRLRRISPDLERATREVIDPEKLSPTGKTYAQTGRDMPRARQPSDQRDRIIQEESNKLRKLIDSRARIVTSQNLFGNEKAKQLKLIDNMIVTAQADYNKAISVDHRQSTIPQSQQQAGPRRPPGVPPGATPVMHQGAIWWKGDAATRGVWDPSGQKRQ